MIHKDLEDISIQKELVKDRVAWCAAIKPLLGANMCVQPKNMEEAP